ncbi:hypothetical protein WH52_05260 [Tenacibaculum holothuriorum]|uniref:Uncharacterized protein n=1 Tax=Tenacibaculum holothuriorum TaxID=1635173 RepID=A0A1Y2PCI6_9FLAO|nr:hypothetical protein [Tenacibaculum holothuriorum]OSY88194.1 hypothetical protein WH52_05260 [Tenacibaculum holothuriorum]
MKQIAKFISRIILILGAFLLFFMWFDMPTTNKKMVGVYVNKNFQNKICCIETPHIPDTLRLFKDGSFFSKFYGKGKWKVNNRFDRIEFILNSKQVSIYTHISNKLFERKKIMMNENTNHHYEKIE